MDDLFTKLYKENAGKEPEPIPVESDHGEGHQQPSNENEGNRFGDVFFGLWTHV